MDLHNLSFTSIEIPRQLAFRVFDVSTEEDKFLKFPIAA